jgi:putative phosphoesterase
MTICVRRTLLEMRMPVTSARTTIPITNDSLRIVVVADTHSHPHARAYDRISSQKPDRILHAGDIGELEVIDALSDIAPTSAVRGNIDVRAKDLPDHLTIDLVEDDEQLLTILLTHIAVNGPRLRSDAVRLAKSEKASLVICGHSHVPFIGRDKDLSIFNPGSIGPRRFQLPIVFGVLQLKDRKVTMKHIDCETGEQWLP